MARADLTGKTVMIAEGVPNSHILSSVISELEKKGATVLLSQHSPTNPDNVSLIADEVAKHEPKIDALLINNPDTSNRTSQIATIALSSKLKDTLPVIVHDWNDDILAVQAIEKAGAKYVGFEGTIDKIAYAVADAVAQHGKPGRKVGG